MKLPNKARLTMYKAMKTEIDRFLNTFNRSPKTLLAYRNGLTQFVKVVGEDAELTVQTYVKFLASLKHKSPSTQSVYRTAVLNFYSFCNAGNWAELKKATRHYTHKSGKRIVNFNREAVEKVVAHCESLCGDLFNLRDRAFVLTLVDTGLRISEACALKRGDIDWLERRAVIIGKGDKQAVIRFSNRAIQALTDYLHARAVVEPASRKPLSSQPLFARHDITASKTIKPIRAGGMWKAIKDRMTEAGVEREQVRIHDFRHYFVTMTYLAKNNLKLSQELARHESIATTNRYAHFSGETDIAYDEIFNQN
jgi:site-specific recombinase XerD